jgi:mannose-6-phosphate isomerase-like protein (cupin superfamily)
MTAGLHPYWLSPEDGEAMWVLGGLYTWKALGEQTGGEYSLCEVRGPTGFAAPLHRHERENEGFFVASGEVTLVLGDGDPPRRRRLRFRTGRDSSHVPARHPRGEPPPPDHPWRIGTRRDVCGYGRARSRPRSARGPSRSAGLREAGRHGGCARDDDPRTPAGRWNVAENPSNGEVRGPGGIRTRDTRVKSPLL